MTSHRPARPRRIGPAGRIALAYIAAHPGCCTADVDRAVRTARGGHRWMYATVGRLMRGGHVVGAASGSRITLRVVSAPGGHSGSARSGAARGYVVIVGREAMPGRPSDELVAASLDASPEGAVPAYAEGGTWHYVRPSDVEHYRRHLRVEVVTVYVEVES